MLSWFERRLDPFPPEAPTEPPKGLIAFCWHYSRAAAPWLAGLGVLTALIGIGEVLMFKS